MTDCRQLRGPSRFEMGVILGNQTVLWTRTAQLHSVRLQGSTMTNAFVYIYQTKRRCFSGVKATTTIRKASVSAHLGREFPTPPPLQPRPPDRPAMSARLFLEDVSSSSSSVISNDSASPFEHVRINRYVDRQMLPGRLLPTSQSSSPKRAEICLSRAEAPPPNWSSPPPQTKLELKLDESASRSCWRRARRRRARRRARVSLAWVVTVWLADLYLLPSVIPRANSWSSTMEPFSTLSKVTCIVKADPHQDLMKGLKQVWSADHLNESI